MKIGRRLAASGLLAVVLLVGGHMMRDRSANGEKAVETAGANHAETLPRKVIVGTCMANFSGTLDDRLKKAVELLDEMSQDAAKRYHGRGLDLAVLPEYAICSGKGELAATEAVGLDGVVSNTLGAAARRLHTYVVVPMLLKEADGSGPFSNAAVLFDREGKVAGIYRKVHPVADLAVDDAAKSLEGGVTPGKTFPVFDCDFGKLGIQICWDTCYGDGWEALAKEGAEVVAWPTASAATIRATGYAETHSYYIISATPRNNAAIYNPTGMTSGQITAEDAGAPRVLVREIDLSYAILGWTAPLQNGAALTRKYGDRVGYQYSSREDEGLFWSNDPKMTIGEMARSLKLPQLADHVEASRKRAEEVGGARD